MKRKEFVEKSISGIATLSITGMLAACNEKNTTLNRNRMQAESLSHSIEKGQKAQLDAKLVLSDKGMKLNVIGDNQIIKLRAEDTGGLYTLIEQNNEPGVGIPPHVHEDEDEVFQVLSGKVEMNIDGKLSTLAAGDLVFCPRGVPHSWKVVGDQKAKAMLSIFPAGLEQMFEELAELPAGPPDLKKVAEICSTYNLKFV